MLKLLECVLELASRIPAEAVWDLYNKGEGNTLPASCTRQKYLFTMEVTHLVYCILNVVNIHKILSLLPTICIKTPKLKDFAFCSKKFT